jgi:hypothetical protein
VHVDRLRAFVDDREMLDFEGSAASGGDIPTQVTEGDGDRQDGGSSQEPTQAQVGESTDVADGTHDPHAVDNAAVESGDQASDGGKDEWFAVQKLVNVKGVGQLRRNQVLWEDGSKLWEPEENVSDNLIRRFHVNKTLAGKTRKRKRKA